MKNHEDIQKKQDLNAFNLSVVHFSWYPCIVDSLKKVDKHYLERLTEFNSWLPGSQKIFSAFSMPIDQVRYVLFGESPYPRVESANGYAFWDQAVTDLWSEKGMSKQVNRATSLRNIIKMLLIAEGLLSPDNTSQEAIAKIDKTQLVKTNNELFSNFISHGFLLLNATPVLQLKNVHKDARAWLPFLKCAMDFLFEIRPDVELLLFGNIAHRIDSIIDHKEIKRLYAEHPYNLSFITNQKVQAFFKPLHLLIAKKS